MTTLKEFGFAELAEMFEKLREELRNQEYLQKLKEQKKIICQTKIKQFDKSL